SILMKNHFGGFAAVITCCASWLNASGENDSKNCWYLRLSQISILFIADARTISFSKPACSFKLGGISNRPALSSSNTVAPFKKYLLNSRTLGSKSFSLLSSEKIGSQLFIGYRVKHFSNTLLMTNWFPSSSCSCFLKPAGRRNRPLASKVASYSPRKPIIYKDLYQISPKLTQNNTFSHRTTKFGEIYFFHNSLCL